VALLYGSPDGPPRLSTGEKWRLDLAATGAFADRSVPLGAVYMLSNRGGVNTAHISSLSAGDAMAELLANIYGNRLFHEELRLQELDTVHRVVGAHPVKAATACADGSLLQQFCEMIIDDVSS
jgi:hypothetical protein